MMKHNAFLIATLMMALTISQVAHAQKWDTTFFAADELEGIEAYYAYHIADSTGNVFNFWSNENTNFRVVSSSGIFDWHGNFNIVRATIGYYDASNKLVEKKDIQLVVADGRGDMAEPNTSIGIGSISNKKKAIQLLNYLRNEEGYIRILIPLYGRIDKFDLTIPCIRNKNN